ncbi:hypothetical protein NPIL_165821 [Nephila pilipes]|uniref:Uncharacterized protein n=1 Tax=Nephila pilipes TaxID=299642 RepID=A0A8X6R4I1_NEPPI|nr:hypothetical protein NPIL_165821 [Nephila pilipes]
MQTKLYSLVIHNGRRVTDNIGYIKAVTTNTDSPNKRWCFPCLPLQTQRKTSPILPIDESDISRSQCTFHGRWTTGSELPLGLTHCDHHS